MHFESHFIMLVVSSEIFHYFSAKSELFRANEIFVSENAHIMKDRGCTREHKKARI